MLTDLNSISEKIIGCAIEVHKHLGPGLLESTYEVCLAFELAEAGLNVQRQVALPVEYKSHTLDAGCRIDLLVEDSVIVELKAVDAILPVHEAQVITYLKLADKRLGLLLNFNTRILSKGIRRFVNAMPE